MQQGGSRYGVSPEMTPFTAATASRSHMLSAGTTDQHKSGDAALAVEVASPISSLPPLGTGAGAGVSRSSGNFDELVPVSGGFPDDDGEEAERGVTGGNRWPRQETLALLKIRSEMDAAFRDATLKGPLWEDVSRKLAELGYNRSAKKCKEKFENVHKYYKRTKEGRAGRQDGKSYRFFSQLEALHSTTTTTAAPPMPLTNCATITAAVVPVSIGIVGSSTRIQPPPISVTQEATTSQIEVPRSAPHDLSAAMATGVSGSSAGISFLSDTSSSSSDSSDQDLDERRPSNTHSRKRKRGSGGGSSSRKMMTFFQGLMQQVMEKQEAMQQRFLETIEKREQDRMIREEAWKRQEIARLTREHDLMAQERTISASRDAAVIAFLQKITGQTIQLQPQVTIPSVPPPPSPPPQSTLAPPPPPAAATPPPPPQHHHHQQQQQQQQQQYHQNTELISRHQPAASSQVVVIAVPEQQHPPPLQEMVSGGSGSCGVSFDPTSSRWPKAEVLALIKLRSGLESRYQEAGPKGPLWEEISAGMKRMGYNRSAKRCKEKWENINKYFKKVKESNKKRPEDAKTCPYFHQLDALYRKKILGSNINSASGGDGGSSSSYVTHHQNKQEQQQQQQEEDIVTTDPNPTTNLQERSDVLVILPPPPPGPSPQTNQSVKTENKNNNNGGNTEVQNSNGGLPASLFGEANIGGGGGHTTASASASAQQPEDIVKELIERHRLQSTMMEDDYDKLEEGAADRDNLDQEEEDEDDEAEDESKMAYKIQLQRQNTGSSNGGGNAATSFMAMVQ